MKYKPKLPEKHDLKFRADDFLIHGTLHLPPLAPNPPVVIGCHGLLSNSSSPKQLALAALCNAAGIGYFRFDHRGCGKSTGDFENVTSLQGRSNDLYSAMQKLTALGFDRQRIGLFGSSLGGSVCLEVASHHAVRAIVIFAAPLKLNVQDSDRIPHNLSFDLSGKLGLISNIHIFHGESDNTVPLSHAQSIFQEVANPKLLTIQKNGDHRMSDPVHQEAFMNSAVSWFSQSLLNY